MTRIGIANPLRIYSPSDGVPLTGIAARRPTSVTDWNVIALNATAIPPNSILQSRALAIVHAAIYDAVRAVDRKGGAYAVDLEAPAGTSVEAAVAAAAHGALVRLAPAQRPDARHRAERQRCPRSPTGQARPTASRSAGKSPKKSWRCAAAMAPMRKVAFTPQAGRRPLSAHPAPIAPAILPQWGDVTPFVLRSRRGLELKGAPAITTAQFARDFEEVKSVGARNSTTRTADQTAAAIFWTVQTAVPWHAAARAASAAKGLSLSENARLFALLSMATADSQIVAFEEKYKRPHWRPITAIRAAADLDIPALKGDPAGSRCW